MSTAASKLRGTAETADVGVPVDGSWQRKGFTSLNGVVTAISVDSGKVLERYECGAWRVFGESFANI